MEALNQRAENVVTPAPDMVQAPLLALCEVRLLRRLRAVVRVGGLDELLLIQKAFWCGQGSK